MRLINTQTRKFEEFPGQDIPKYAILSHTWETEEVLYQDYETGRYQHMQGYAKIDKTCCIAAENGIDYAWVDTCCIDKRSSAELSEAINSMFRWYQDASVCYVFLADLPPGANWNEEDLGKCRWFTRGWTLQELIAPEKIVFFDCIWGTRAKKSASTRNEHMSAIASITKINAGLLKGDRSLDSICVAQKLSWASRRSTTRKEDMAYCLFGLLGVHMPLLYGEGDQAFRRLQEEVMRSSADLSIFAWTQQLPEEDLDSRMSLMDLEDEVVKDSDRQWLSGVLASSPADFQNCRRYESIPRSALHEFSMTNVGIKIQAGLFKDGPSMSAKTHCALPLACRVPGGIELGLGLRHVGRDHYLRRDPFHLEESELVARYAIARQEIYLRPTLPPYLNRHRNQSLPARDIFSKLRASTLYLKTTPNMDIYDVWPAVSYDMEDGCFFTNNGQASDFCVAHVGWRLSLHGISEDVFRQYTIIVYDWTLGARFARYSIDKHPLPDGVPQTLTRIKNLGNRLDEMPVGLIRQIAIKRFSQQQSISEELSEYDLSTEVEITLPRDDHPLRLHQPTLQVVGRIFPKHGVELGEND